MLIEPVNNTVINFDVKQDIDDICCFIIGELKTVSYKHTKTLARLRQIDWSGLNL